MKKEISLPSFDLFWLNSSVVREDFAAVKNAAAHIRAITGEAWPDESFSCEEDAEELREHEREFLAGKSFAYAVRKNGTQIGSLYFYRSDKKCFDFVCTLWTGNDIDDRLLYKEAKDYMMSFPFRIAYVPFEISRKEYAESE